MKYKLPSIILIACFSPALLLGQHETYTVKKAPFSSDKYDEFAPVYYKNGIVFTTNRNPNLINYSNSQNKGLYKIDFVDTTQAVSWEKAKLFSKELTSKYNDGPVTFTGGNDTIFYSRNLDVSTTLHDVSAPRNKLGIFWSVREGSVWTKPREFRADNEWYNITSPCISPDGKRLYFASDKEGGLGGSDLYYSQWKDGYWNDPVNLGPVINSSGNESYPFINHSGELFFSSDGRQGLGGKDIYFSRMTESGWSTPVPLDPPINSKFDDFGIITDSVMSSGYFSSSREKSIDIFQFKTNYQQVFYAATQKQNQYCFSFIDTGIITIDTARLAFEWDFGDGGRAPGLSANHCFPGSGNYAVSLNVKDKATGKNFFTKLSYAVAIRDFEQPFISSIDASYIGDSIDFDSRKSYLPGSKILSYTWNFGDGTRAQGEKARHAFDKEGEYIINLGLSVRSQVTGLIEKTGTSKKVRILADRQTLSNYLVENRPAEPPVGDVRQSGNARVNVISSAEADLAKDALFFVEVYSSDISIGADNSILKKIPSNYRVDEIYDNISKTYSYVVDRQMNLMAAYPAYREMVALGFEKAKIRAAALTDPAEKELLNIKRIFGIVTDAYFDNLNRLTSSGYLMLDQVVKVMSKYPDKKFSISIHTDNTGSHEEKLALSKAQALIVYNYLINKGIEKQRLESAGYGDTRPIADPATREGRALNRRIDISVIIK